MAKRKKRSRVHRRRRHNPGYSYNPRRRGRKGHRRGRRHSRNPGMTLRRPVGMLTSGFKPARLKNAGLMAGGAFLNGIISSYIVPNLPAGAAQKYGSYVIEIATAGLFNAIPKVGEAMSDGALVGVVIRAGNEFIPHVGATMKEFVSTNTRMAEFATERTIGMNEFATAADFADIASSSMIDQ